MWSPTHVQVLVKRARGLKIKGKNGTNDPFVTIGLGKEKFQTSVVEKTQENVDWMEQCELGIPNKGNTAEILLTVLHRNFLGVDEFLGRVSLPLSGFDHHEKPRSRWYPLQCKPGQNKSDYRGELEVRVEFKINAREELGGSVSDLRSKKKGSNKSLNVGGSLMNIGNKQVGIKKLASSVGHKLDKVGGKAKKSISSLKLNKEKKLSSVPEGEEIFAPSQTNLDPGVNSDEEDDIDDIFQKVKQSGSNLSLNRNTSSNSLKSSSPQPPKKPERSFIEPGNSGDIFKFDCKIERNPLKQSTGSLDRVVANQSQDEANITKREKKKAKKEKREKKKELSAISDVIPTEIDDAKEGFGLDDDVTAEIGLSLEETKPVLTYSQDQPSQEAITKIKGPPLELAVMNKFNGKTREDLIKLVVVQQNAIDMQGKKITDLESYIDSLLSRVIEVAPVLLHKDVKTSNRAFFHNKRSKFG